MQRHDRRERSPPRSPASGSTASSSLVAECSRSDAPALSPPVACAVDGEARTSRQAAPHGGPARARRPVAAARSPRCPQPDPTVEFTVVHDDEHVIVIDKPAGLVVHPGAGNPDGTLVNGLLARYPRDRRASASRTARASCTASTSARRVCWSWPAPQRAYDALVDAARRRATSAACTARSCGATPTNPHGVIDAPIGRDHRDPMRMAVVVDGKPARTRYQVLQQYRHVRPRSRRWSAGSRRAAPTRSACTSAPSATRWSATRTYGGVRVRTARRPARSCTPPARVRPPGHRRDA